MTERTTPGATPDGGGVFTGVCSNGGGGPTGGGGIGVDITELYVNQHRPKSGVDPMPVDKIHLLHRNRFCRFVCMTNRNMILMCAAVVLALAACGSDEKAATDTTVAAADITAATTAVSTAETVAVTVAEPVETTADTTDATTAETDAADSSLTPLAVDEAPVCAAFSRIITASFLTGVSGLSEDGPLAAVEQKEVVVYAGLASEAAILRSDVPSELISGLDPLLQRVEFADDALIAGGFNDDDVLAIAAAWGGLLDAIIGGDLSKEEPDEQFDQAKIEAAAETFVAEVGTFAEFQQSDISDDTDEAGSSWLKETCPILSSGSG